MLTRGEDSRKGVLSEQRRTLGCIADFLVIIQPNPDAIIGAKAKFSRDCSFDGECAHQVNAGIVFVGDVREVYRLLTVHIDVQG